MMPTARPEVYSPCIFLLLGSLGHLNKASTAEGEQDIGSREGFWLKAVGSKDSNSTT